MLSNMIANLTDMKAMDKFDAALAEIPAVRKDLGYPPLVTPLSQMVGNQAVTNVLLGERYKQISKEVKNYFKGEYGIAPAPVSKELEEKILGEGGKPVDCRIEDAKRTGEDFKKAKAALGDLARSEEDVMKLHLLSGSDHEVPRKPQGQGRKRRPLRHRRSVRRKRNVSDQSCYG